MKYKAAGIYKTGFIILFYCGYYKTIKRKLVLQLIYMSRTEIEKQEIGRCGVVFLPEKSLVNSDEGIIIQPMLAEVYGNFTGSFFYAGLIPYVNAPQIYKKIRIVENALKTERVLKGEAKVFPFDKNRIQLHEQLPGKEYFNSVTILYNSNIGITEIWLSKRWEEYQNKEKELERILNEGMA